MSRKYTYAGTVHQIGPVQNYKSGFSKRTLVLKNVDEKYTNYAAFEFMKDKVGLLDRLQPGDVIEVEFFIQARENPKQAGSWFSSNRAVGFSFSRGSGSPAHSPAQQSGGYSGGYPDDGDMPF